MIPYAKRVVVGWWDSVDATQAVCEEREVDSALGLARNGRLTNDY